MGDTGSLGSMQIIFGSVIKSWYTSLNIKLERIGGSLCPRPQYTDLAYMGGTVSGVPMRIIFGSII